MPPVRPLTNRTILGSLIAGVVVFFVLFAFGMLWWGIILGFVAIVGAAFVLRSVEQRPEPVVDPAATYEQDTRASVTAVRDTVARIDTLSAQIRDPGTAAAVRGICSQVPDLLDLVGVKAPDKLGTTASRWEGAVGTVRSLLESYLKMQADPDAFPDAHSLMAQTSLRFGTVRDAAADSIRALNQDDVLQLRANLDALVQQLPKPGGTQ